MRVLLDCRMATWSGIGRYSTGLARALAHTGEVDLVQVIEEGTTPPVPEAPAMIARAHAFMPAGGREFGRIAAEVQPDITHCLHVPTPIPAPHPLVVTIHDLTPLVVPSVMPSLVRRVAYRWWNARAAKHADLILANSQATRADIERFFPRAAGRVRVIAHAADDFATVDRGPLPAGLVPNGSRYLLSMGNVKPHKDLPTLLRAFATLHTNDPELRLLLVGRGFPGYVASVLGADPASAAVSFTGHVDDATLRTLYANATVFVFPSRYEGFGLPPLEAMIAGTPVVCSDAASLPEVVGDAAVLFPAGDVAACAAAIARVMEEPDLRARLVSAGARRVRSFTWERTAAATLAAYRELLGAK